MADSSVTIVGNLTRDPEMKYTAGGQANAKFGMAVSRRWQNKQTQEWEEQTSFLNVVCWRDLAENVVESLQKGSRAIVTGRIEQRSWETDDGDKRSVVEIIADEVGPSLRWATAEIVRNERTGGYQQQSPGPVAREARHEPARPPQQPQQQRAAAPARQSTDEEFYGEEPF